MGIGRADLADQTATNLGDTRCVELHVGQQFSAFSVFDKPIGDPESANTSRVQAQITGRFEHGAAESAGQRALFDGQHETTFG